MTFDEFKVFDFAHREANPVPFSLATSDAKASVEQIKVVEAAVQVQLPAMYRSFLSQFGGGDFGYVNIFSADPNGKWYLPDKLRVARRYIPADLLAFSDDFAGGYYVLTIKDGAAAEQVCYWNRDGGTTETEFSSVIDFVVQYAYEPA